MRAWEISDTAPLIILFIGTPPNAALITSWDLDKLLNPYNLSWGLDITLVTSLEPKYSLDLDKVSLMSHNLSLLLLRLFFKLDWATFSKMASLDLDKYRLRSVILSRHVWHDLLLRSLNSSKLGDVDAALYHGHDGSRQAVAE